MERLGHQWQLFQTRGENHDIQCYAISHLAKMRLKPTNKRNKLCCYKMGKPKHPEDWRDVEQTRREASYVRASTESGHVLINEPWPDFYFNIDEVLENVEAHKICCADPTKELCDRFYQIFPDMGCTDFVVFVPALGDPHITTLDGVTYTMNGWEEYILMEVKSENFTLQARTGRVESLNESANNATVFTAFAASEGGYAKFQVELANNNRTMIVYVNGMDVTDDYNTNRKFQMLLDKISVLREDSSNKTLVIATFPCGVSIKVSVAVKSLDIELEIDKSLENKTLGLLGNFNHNKTDEFTLPNGTVLPSNMSERELLYSFGRHWEVSAHNTIFTYGKRENSSTFSHPDFVPLFGDEVSPETARVAEQTCGKNNTECIIDYVVTGSTDFASSTMQSFLKQQSFVSNLANNPPDLSLKNDSLNSLGQWSVTESKDATLEVFPEDADGDVVSIELVGTHTGASVRNRSIFYTPDAKNPINLGIPAKDSKGAYSPIVYVTIAVCTGCNGHGACTLNTRSTGNSEGYFQVLQCSCFPAYTGSDCDSELDACASKPCSDGQGCTDLTAAQQGNNVTGYVCGTCPVGYSDYNKKCVDTNECTESNGLCQHNCTNTEGSYICSCRQGFRLDATNKKTCTDVNECEEQTSQCKHTCKNTEGSYNCSCYEGYNLKSDGYTCELTSNGKRECEHCQHICLFNETTNTASCVCDKGYKPDPNNTTECLDINECELLNMPCSQSCNNTDGNFKCYCYTGFKLESDMVSCKACEIPSYGEDCAKTCQCNGRGSCNTVKGCVCDVNWTGVNCDIDVDECASQGSCPEGQLCHNTYGSFTCSCPTGYVFAGQVCNDTDECSNLQVNVTCDLRKEVCINTVGSYWCDCKQGYARDNSSTCQDIDECALHVDGCQHMCHNVEGRFNCECDYGYILEDNRKSCTRIRDLCVGHHLNCTHGCSVDDTNKPYCICPRGYTRNINIGQDTCIDINECTSPENNSCSYKLGCNNTDGGYTCSCPAGSKLENNRRNCLACPGNTWGPECSQNCACGIGAKICDPTTGCVCVTGFQGKYCTDDIDECEIHNLTCPGKQQCVNTYGSAMCVCPSGFEYDAKLNCVDINECSSEHSCTQICTNTVGSYSCSCYEGYIYNATTNTCLDIDECGEGTHKCHEKCVNTEGSYRCSCETGLFLQLDGVSCEVHVPCINTTSCSEKCANINGIETCLCGKGKVLATDKTSCDDLDLCKNTSCTEGCVETRGNTSFECLCNTGKYLAADGITCSECVNGKYGLNCIKICSCETANTKSCNVVDGTCECQSGWKGNNCMLDEDECGNGSASCQSHSTCMNTQGSFTCVCNDGFILRESICKECDDNFYGPNCSIHCSCGAHSKCNKTDGACYCKQGWKGNNCDVDIDECHENIHNCSSTLLEVCSNTEGGYKCVCNAGYTKLCDSCKCMDINECASAENNSCSYKPGCNNTDGGYTCSCPAGSKLDNNGQNCQECDDNFFGPNCSSNCSCGAHSKCNKTDGACYCKQGWKGNHCAIDIDECLENIHNCSSTVLEVCSNTEGGYKCVCNAGYSKLCDSCECKDINECVSAENNSCSYKPGCNNTDGGYTCSCPAGSKLDNNGQNCLECTADTYGLNCSQSCSCVIVNTKACDTINGHCVCLSGWKGDRCESDVNECTEQSVSCQQNSHCVNTAGSFTCLCDNGFYDDTNGQCKECTADTYGLNCSQSCSCVMANTKACDTINGHCVCLSGWKGDRCELDVNECTEQLVSCRQNSHCVNTAGSFTCLCDNGFYDDTNGQCKALSSTHKVAAVITLDYNISNINFADQSSESYKSLAETVQNGLLESLKKVEPSVISLTVTKLSKGSLIVDTEITMGTKNSTEKASEVVLGKALVEMMQSRNAIMIDSTPVVVSTLTLNGGELLKNDGACDIQFKIEPCSASDVCEEVGNEAVCKHKIEKDSQNLIIGLSVGLSLFTILFVSIWIIFCCWVKQNKAKNRVENNEPMDLFKSQTDRKSTLFKQLSTHGGGDDQSQGTDDNTDGSSWRNSVLAYQSSNSRITRPKLLVSGSMTNTSSDTKYRGHQGSADTNGSGNEMMTSYNL